MRAIGLRILTDTLNEYGRLVVGGETVVVTDHPRVVAELVGAHHELPERTLR
jgi:antitoxin (DNA-binding transcriptional repressor) of toxin-antitoxin stability system